MSEAEGRSGEGAALPQFPGQQPPKGFQQSTRRTLAEIGVLVAALLLILASLRGCAGCLTSIVVAQLPPSADAMIGKAGGEAMRLQYGSGEAPAAEQTARVQRVFDELRESLTPEDKAILVNPRVTVVRDPQVNAFALPGGEVFVLTGLLDRVKEDDDLLRGVLAHELGHAVRRHGMRSLVRNGIYGLAVTFILGGVDEVSATIVAGSSHLDKLQYSRSMEEESDEFGAMLLERAGHNTEGLARFLESLESVPVPELLSTHPDSGERAKAIRERASTKK
jgi:predicted Zn-dependent protease